MNYPSDLRATTGSMTQIKLGIGIPAYGGKVSAAHTRMWLEVGAALADNRERFVLTLPIAHVDVCQVDKARNMLVDMATRAQCDWLLMLDADTYVEDGVQLLQMISSADREGYKVVVGAVPRRNTDGTRELMAYRREVGVEGYHRMAAVTDDALRAEPGPLVQIDEAATACMAINIPFVADQVPMPVFEFTSFASEDRHFCRRVAQRLGRIAVDKRVQTRHVNKPAVLTWDGGAA